MVRFFPVIPSLIFGWMMKRKLTGKDFLLFAEAWVFLAKARWLLLFRPFNKIVPMLKNDPAVSVEADNALLQLVKLSIARASVKSPWRTKCFEQALAARMMLGKRGIASRIYFGVKKNDDSALSAHAWLQSGNITVTGWQKITEYTVVATF